MILKGLAVVKNRRPESLSVNKSLCSVSHIKLEINDVL